MTFYTGSFLLDFTLARAARPRGGYMVCRSSGFLSALSIAVLAALTGCVGKSGTNPSNGTVQSVTLTPTSASIDLGASQALTATAQNAAGSNVVVTIHYVPSCVPDQLPCAPLTVATNATGQVLVCAGTWDSLTNPLVCTPGAVGVAQVTAVAEGVSSPPATIYVHQHIESIQVSPIGDPSYDCFSQGETWNYQASAYGANGVDITNTVGPFNWSFTPANVLTTNTKIEGLLSNQVQVTANNPGIAQLFASVSGVSATPVPYTTCLVSSVMLQVQNGSGNSINVAAGSTKTIVASVVDTRSNIVSKPSLTWNTSDPEIATVADGTVTGRQSPGAAAISASCTPPTCNIGVLPGLPIYSSGGKLQNGRPDPNGQPAFGVISVNVTNSKIPTYTVWAGTTDCADNLACNSVMFPVTAGSDPIGSAVTIPRTPNSMLFTAQGSRIYLGSSQGLMYLDATASPPTLNLISQADSPCNVTLCGKVLAISPDGNRVVVADTQTSPNQVYIYDTAHASSPVDLLIDGAAAAAFSPDGMKIFILAASGNTGSLYVYSTVDALLSVPISTSASDVAFSADGSFAYVAGTPAAAVSGFATCNIQNIGASSPALASNPLRIFPLPTTSEQIINFDHSLIAQNLLALEPPNIQLLTAQFSHDPLLDGQFSCNAPQLSLTAGNSYNLGQGDFTPLYVQAVGDGSQVVVVAKNIPAVLVFNANGGTTSAIPLINGASPQAAASSPDGSQVFVAACDVFQNNDPNQPCTAASVHIVNTQLGGDVQQASYTNLDTNNSMCTNLGQTYCIPNLVAVRPQ